MRAMKITAISVLGTQKDAHGGVGPARWNTWRPTIGLVQQESLPIDELHLILNKEFMPLAERVKADIKYVSPETKVVFDIVQLKDPWDFEEVYGKFYDYAKSPCFHKEKTDYYIHISTGSHVEQICLFLLAESRHLAAKLVQTSPKEGHVRHSHDPKGTINVIDLDLSRYDRLAKRFELERQDDLSFLKRGIDTKNAAFNKLIETIERVAVRSSAPILLTGPTGAGKSQLAEQIYLLKKQSGKVKGAFVAVNCATLGGDLAKSALFGHKKGAYSGAGADHDGFLKEADGGIVFLDEIGELPLEAQAMLLKAIEEKSFRPLGAAKDEHSDFQLICGTNRDLAVDVADKRFRADLLSRINLWSFTLPGLAERREDIEPNLVYELARFSAKSGTPISFSCPSSSSRYSPRLRSSLRVSTSVFSMSSPASRRAFSSLRISCTPAFSSFTKSVSSSSITIGVSSDFKNCSLNPTNISSLSPTRTSPGCIIRSDATIWSDGWTNTFSWMLWTLWVPVVTQGLCIGGGG